MWNYGCYMHYNYVDIEKETNVIGCIYDNQAAKVTEVFKTE